MAPRNQISLHDLMDCYRHINTDPECCVKRTKCKKHEGHVKQTTDDPHALFNRSPGFFKGIDLDAIGHDTPDDTDEETDTDFDDDDLIKGVETDQDEDSDAELDDGRENTHNKDTETDDDDDEEYKALKKANEERKKEQKLREKAAAEAEAEAELEVKGKNEKKNKNDKLIKRDENVAEVNNEEVIRSLLSSVNPSGSTLLTTTSTVVIDREPVTSTAFVTAGAADATALTSAPAVTVTETLVRNPIKEDFDNTKEFFTGTGIGLATGTVLIFLTASFLAGGFVLYKKRFSSGSGKP